MTTDPFHNMTTEELREAEAEAFNRARALRDATISRLRDEAIRTWPLDRDYRVTGPGEYEGRVMRLSSLIPSVGYRRTIGACVASANDYRVIASGRLATRGSTTGDGYGRRWFTVLATRLEPMP